MSTRATGSFDVTMNPEPQYDGFEGGTVLGRLSLSKTFHGDLEATGQVLMLSAGTAIKGSAGYVAIERIEGTLRGRSGSFALLHQGTMRRGADFQLRIVVVPDSGTGALAGIGGVMTIRIENGDHDYDFDYTLPAERGGE